MICLRCGTCCVFHHQSVTPESAPCRFLSMECGVALCAMRADARVCSGDLESTPVCRVGLVALNITADDLAAIERRLARIVEVESFVYAMGPHHAAMLSREIDREDLTDR